MLQPSGNKASSGQPKWLVILAFAAVYLIWGSTYFFIRIAVNEIPPFLLGTLRFTFAGVLLLSICFFKKEKVWNKHAIKSAAIAGIPMLFLGNGVVIWVEQYLESGLVAILVSSAPLWFVLLDSRKWKFNFSSRKVIGGLVIGFTGVILLFYEKISGSFGGSQQTKGILSLFLLLGGSVAWTAGSLYSKYNTPSASTQVVAAWQMLWAAITFLVILPFTGELDSFHWTSVSAASWLAAGYLVIFGSIVAFTAYVWLLNIRPATQVSTYGYVNPVVAVLLGILFANEAVTLLQITGLAIILGSVLLINTSGPVPEKKTHQPVK